MRGCRKVITVEVRVRQTSSKSTRSFILCVSTLEEGSEFNE